MLRKCLAKDPDSRYQGMRDLVVDLRAVREAIGTVDSSSRSFETAPLPVVTAPARPPLVWVGVALVMATLGGGAWWALGRRSAEPATADTQMPARPAVAVVAFDVVSGAPEIAWLGKGLPQLLVTGLAQTPDLEVIGSERLSDAARQIGASLDSVDSSRRGELARRAGARFVVTGTIIRRDRPAHRRARRGSHHRRHQARRERTRRRRAGARR